jgi:hypothetical protein
VLITAAMLRSREAAVAEALLMRAEAPRFEEVL